ncbi:acyl-CoA dehydrogenase [Streptomyces spiroverticillatus]|uniref:Acyl-CoA dehydrogenase n=1 Tax=Streptomyces finlayi TaxID=67296 RepID=A0A918X4J5_9ACTN|nr:acyl-CoA dehydrogenase family protein [Streptomyces finlayi]GHA31817.1 acyl-CoA dehydrogenase [Streptomyces spiroverticillatus]GHD10880.1 acyl-CoA dehydrogenase [Streptomyces finlayi]
MDFAFTPAQNELAQQVAEFTADKIAPYSNEHDRRGTYRRGLFADLGAARLFALRLPRAYGGLGLDAVSAGIALEQLAAADLSVCFPVLNAALVGGVLADNGSPEQLDRWLPPIARGESVVALALTEPDHGTDAAGIQLRAEPDGDGWLLTGEKTSIMVATYATHALVFARTGGAGAGGISAFYTSLDSERVKREQLSDLGCKAGGRGRLLFDGLRVGPEDLVGEPGGGFTAVMRGFGVSRALIALMAIAVGNAALDAAYAHAGRRTAFGRPIGRFQSVSFPLVEHTTLLHAARLVSYEALCRADLGEDPRIPSNMAKWWAPKAAVEATHQALLTLGHQGWSEDGPVAQRLRDVIGLQLADGTAAATKLTVARLVLGKEYAP